MIYTVKIVRRDDTVRIAGNCTAGELDLYLRKAAKQCKEGERCVYARVS